MKECVKCHKEKELKDFPKEERNIDNRSNTCKACRGEKSKERYLQKKKEREMFF